MPRTLESRAPARGVTLLEAVISLSLLAIGIVGTMQLQVFGITADSAARAHTQAVQVARELLVALEQLSPEDPRIAEQFTGGTSPPAGFGRLLQPSGELSTAAFQLYDDSLDLVDVTTDETFIARSVTDPEDPTLPRFRRRWTAWAPEGPITSGGSKLLAVSVTWHERGLPGLREIVLYGQVTNAAAVTAYANLLR